MAFKLQNMDNLSFLLLLKKYKPLWDASDKTAYNNKLLKEECYKKLIQDIRKPEVTITDIKQKIRLLKAAYGNIKNQLKNNPNYKMRAISWFEFADSLWKQTDQLSKEISTDRVNDESLNALELSEYFDENGEALQYLIVDSEIKEGNEIIIADVNVENHEIVSTEQNLEDIHEEIKDNLEYLEFIDDEEMEVLDSKQKNMECETKRKVFINEEQESLLVLKLYRRFDVLWNSDLEKFNSSKERSEALFCILRELIDTYGIYDYSIYKLRRKIQAIKSEYAKELSKVRNANDLYLPKLSWFPYADSFLRAYTKTEETSKNRSKKEQKPKFIKVECVEDEYKMTVTSQSR